MPPSLARIRCGCHAHAVLHQKLRKKIANVLVVVDDENVNCGLHQPLLEKMFKPMSLQSSFNNVTAGVKTSR
jgi:hypothetical protein